MDTPFRSTTNHIHPGTGFRVNLSGTTSEKGTEERVSVTQSSESSERDSRSVYTSSSSMALLSCMCCGWYGIGFDVAYDICPSNQLFTVTLAANPPPALPPPHPVPFTDQSQLLPFPGLVCVSFTIIVHHYPDIMTMNVTRSLWRYSDLAEIVIIRVLIISLKAPHKTALGAYLLTQVQNGPNRTLSFLLVLLF